MHQQFEHRPHRDREEGRGRREGGRRKKREGDFGGKSSLFNSDVISGSNMYCGFQLVSESPPGFEVSMTLLWGPELSERSTSSERAHLAALLVHLSICSSVTQVSWRSPPCHAWKVGGGVTGRWWGGQSGDVREFTLHFPRTSVLAGLRVNCEKTRAGPRMAAASTHTSVGEVEGKGRF